MVDISAPIEPTSVLVVEDDAALRTLFIALLTRQNFRVECVNDGAQALQRLARNSYAVVLLDLMMPGTNGFDVLRELAKSQPALLARTIVTTGVSERELAKIDRRKIFAVLRKPFDIDVLVTTIRNCAEQQRDETLDVSARKLETALPDLKKLLGATGGGNRERLLRGRLRGIVGELAGAFSSASAVERDALRARRYEELGKRAWRTATAPPGQLEH